MREDTLVHRGVKPAVVDGYVVAAARSTPGLCSAQVMLKEQLMHFGKLNLDIDHKIRTLLASARAYAST